MKTTLNISGEAMQALKREAARRGRTMSELAEAAMRTLLREPRKGNQLPALPAFRTGGARVNVANREVL